MQNRNNGFSNESQCFSCKLLPRSWLNIFRVNIRKGKKQENKHNLGTHYSKMANTVANFHPATSILDLLSIGILVREVEDLRENTNVIFEHNKNYIRPTPRENLTD